MLADKEMCWVVNDTTVKGGGRGRGRRRGKGEEGEGGGRGGKGREGIEGKRKTAVALLVSCRARGKGCVQHHYLAGVREPFHQQNASIAV